MAAILSRLHCVCVFVFVFDELYLYLYLYLIRFFRVYLYLYLYLKLRKKMYLYLYLYLIKRIWPQPWRIMTDNVTAMTCVNKQGSTISKSRNCNDMTREIWQFAMMNDLWLSAAYCPGVQNVEADEKSRIYSDQTEWTLRRDLFEEICEKFGIPSIDLFASRLNNQVERYCAWEPDPGAVYIDSFLYEWGKERLVYAFPPFSIIHKVIQKFIHDGARGIIVAPIWPTQPWFSLLKRITCGSETLKFRIDTDELFLPFSNEQVVNQRRHPLAGKLQLMVQCCNGHLFKWEDSHNPW